MRIQGDSIYESYKRKAFSILEATEEGGLIGKAFNIFIMCLIALNVLFIIIEDIDEYHKAFYDWFEKISVYIFTVEYVLRIWSCTVCERFNHPLRGRLRYAVMPLALIDLIAILPFYLRIIILEDLLAIRIIRIFRILRVLKIVRYSQSLRTFGGVLSAKKDDLILTFSAMLILLFLSSIIIFVAEQHRQPEAFGNLLDALYWSVLTLTTVGANYHPITPLGKFISGFISIIGVGLFAAPAGILASGFMEENIKRKTEDQVCPHCGKKI